MKDGELVQAWEVKVGDCIYRGGKWSEVVRMYVLGASAHFQTLEHSWTRKGRNDRVWVKRKAPALT